MNRTNIRSTVYLAGLLHDIGKFWQRGDDFLVNSKNVSENVKGLIGFLCPEYKGRVLYQHVIWTYQFFETFKKKFKQLKIETTDNLQERDDDNLVNLAIYHHNPQSELQALIQLADWWSSGMDRRNESVPREQVDFGKYKFKKVPLHSLFTVLRSETGEGDLKRRDVYPLKSLNIEDETCLFPVRLDDDNVNTLDVDYSEFYKEFSNEVELLPIDNVRAFTESLLYLLKKYTWCIPSSTTDMANVSLFEHLKSTAAIADCLYAYKQYKPSAFIYESQRLKLNENEYPLLMFCCDISGIQSFINNIASRKAAVSLKGRSFYLQMLIDSIIEKIVFKTGTTLGHVIYSSGGKFYMLLPNIPEIKEGLYTFQKELEKNLWEEQKGKIYACLAWIPFNYQNFSTDKSLQISSSESQLNGSPIDNLGHLWSAVSDKASLQKGRRFENLLTDDFNGFFGPIGKGELNVCAVTGEEVGNGELVKFSRKDVEPIEVLPVVKQQAELGYQLKDAKYWATSLTNISNIFLNNRNIESYIQPLNIGVHQYLLDSESVSQLSSVDNLRLRKINSTDFLADNLKGNQNSYGFTFYGGNKQSLNSSGDEKTFEQLADNTFLGVLKLDVDGLGNIFKDGFPNNNKTFSSYATLSSSLDYFFSGFINTIRERYCDWVNIIYSGGDDLFAVGRWDQLLLFTADVRKEFRRFVSGREDISLSAGISLCGDKFPISLAAKHADEYENMAKNHKSTNSKIPNKNALSFFGETINWESEYEIVFDLMKHFHAFCSGKYPKLSKGFLQKMMSFKALKDSMIESENMTEGKKKNDYSYRWNSAYYIKRMMDKYHKDNEVFYFLDTQIKNKIFTSDRQYDLIALAARWAELYIKEGINLSIK